MKTNKIILHLKDSKTILSLGVLVGLSLILFLFLQLGYIWGLAFALLPLFCLGIYLLLKNPFRAFAVLYLVNFFIHGIVRYVNLPIPVGVVFDVFLGFSLFSILLYRSFHRLPENTSIPPLFYLTVLWLLYCILEIINPQSTVENWISTVRGLAFYLVAFPIIVFLLLNKVKYYKAFLLFWAVLILLGGVKAFFQKTIGFDSAEHTWLYTYGAHTHLIYSGVRYFSFFSDAANFGCHMGLGMVVFSILAIYEKSVKLKVFYCMVVIMATYGMMVSGTRAAMAVPFVGLACFIVIIRQWRLVAVGGVLLIFVFCIFNFTTIGNSNATVRRMRTAFRFEKDASYNLRKENQQKMSTFMHYYPFGLGIGSSKHAKESGLMSNMATDSSFVMIWVETGTIGALLYIFIWTTFLLYGTYCVLFRLKHPFIRGSIAALTSGLAGMMVAGYGNEVFHQFPTGPTLYMIVAFILLSPQFDKELLQNGRI